LAKYLSNISSIFTNIYSHKIWKDQTKEKIKIKYFWLMQDCQSTMDALASDQTITSSKLKQKLKFNIFG